MEYIFDSDSDTNYKIVKITNSNCDDYFLKIKLAEISSPVWVLCFGQYYYVSDDVFKSGSFERKYYKAYLQNGTLVVSCKNDYLILDDDN